MNCSLTTFVHVVQVTTTKMLTPTLSSFMSDVSGQDQTHLSVLDLSGLYMSSISAPGGRLSGTLAWAWGAPTAGSGGNLGFANCAEIYGLNFW